MVGKDFIFYGIGVSRLGLVAMFQSQRLELSKGKGSAHDLRN